jgi:hypothetical protein
MSRDRLLTRVRPTTTQVHLNREPLLAAAHLQHPQDIHRAAKHTTLLTRAHNALMATCYSLTTAYLCDIYLIE